MRRLTLAAEKGDADAQFNLGVFCGNHRDDNGYLMADNRTEAIKWLLAAAEQGLPRAQIRLAETYADRPDSEGNHADACFWFLLAEGSLSNAHREHARSGYERSAAELSPTEITALRKRVRLWTPTPSGAPATKARQRNVQL